MSSVWNAIWGTTSSSEQKEPECMTHFTAACRKLQMGQQQEAYQGFMYSIQIDSEYKIEQRITPLMKLLESMDKYDEMIEIADRLLSSKPNAVGLLIWKGVGLKGINKMDECVECFEKAVELQPQSDMIVTLYCAVLIEQEAWPKFLEINKKMIEMRPTAGSYHNNYIQALENLNEREKADQHVSIILDKYGATAPSINFICGDYYYKHEIYEKAELCLHKAAQLDVKNEKYQQYYIRSLLQNGKQMDADKYCQQLINKDPNNVRWINTVGYICFDAFDFESAARHFKKCMALQPNDAYNVVDYCMVLCELNRLDEAEKLIKAVLAKNPNFISGQYRLARIYEYKNMYNESQEIYVKIIKVNPMKAKMNMGYAHLLYLMQEYEKSMKYFQIAQKIDAANPWFHFWFGLLLMSNKYKRYSEATQCFDKCLKLQTTHLKCHYEYACLLYNILNKNKLKAIQLMKEAVRIDYNNEKYKNVLKEFENNCDIHIDAKDDDKNDDDEKKENGDGNKLLFIRKKEYIFKSIDNENKCITVMDNDFKDIVFRLDKLNLDEIKNINDKIVQGANNKKDVKIVVVETHTKNNQITKKVSHAVCV